MAQVVGQRLPPSLISGYGNVLSTAAQAGTVPVRVGLTKTARQAQVPAEQNAALVSKRQAAAWLVEQWQPQQASAFYAARLNALHTFTFEPTYWVAVTASRDRTEYGVPVILAYERPVNGQYADPLRVQSNCVFNHWSKTYNTPLGDGTANEPAPGWQGTVLDQRWRDLYFAQRRLTFYLPVPITEEDGRPVLMDINTTVTATASFRGNRSWFARGIYPDFGYEAAGALLPANYLITHWDKDNLYPLDLQSSTAPYWQATDTRRLLVSARQTGSWRGWSRNNRLGLVLTTPPSRGVYFARNDDVKVIHHETVTVYVGKGPHG